MKSYSFNESVSQEDVNAILESAGYDAIVEDDTMVVCIGDELFGLHEAVEEFDGQLFVRIFELDSNLFESVKNTVEPITSVEVDDVVYEISDEAYEGDGEVYLALVSEEDEHEDEEEVVEENFLSLNGEDYVIVESEEEAEYVAYLRGNDEDGYELVDDEDDADVVAYLNSTKE